MKSGGCLRAVGDHGNIRHCRSRQQEHFWITVFVRNSHRRR